MFGNDQQTEPETQEAPKSNDAPYYCPGCGRRANYMKECSGSPTAPHPPIEVVSTDELSGPPEDHTPAPGVA